MMKARGAIILVMLLSWCLVAYEAIAQDIVLQGGDATSDDISKRAYDQSIPNIIDPEQQLLQDVGFTGFLRDFGRVKLNGRIRLGPQFNARSCAQCHSGNGRGIGRLSPRSRFSDTVVKVSMVSGTSQFPGSPVPVPYIGLQLHDHAIRPRKPDGSVSLDWSFVEGRYADGTPFSLRAPSLKVRLHGRKVPTGIRFSVRRAPPIFGSGVLEALSEEEVLALADPLDSNRDGISGKANFVWDVLGRKRSLGRFGFKAGHPTLVQQIAAAYAVDMGVSNALFRSGRATPEISEHILQATTFYTATRAIPRARMQDDPVVVAGKGTFQSMGCADCHVVQLHTSRSPLASISNQTVHPFTDLLLHDMGPALADGRTEYDASGSEWRTTPLWGIGLTEVVLDGKAPGYLHDGRARTLEEAILWHGGEADTSRARFMAASAHERHELIQFLRSL